MNEYHKIQNVFKRDMTIRENPLIWEDWTCPEFGYLANNKWLFTEKVDGTNIRICWDMYSVAFKGRTENAQLPGRLVTRLRELFPNDDKFEQVFEPGEVCLYGEGYGAGIQKGGCYGSEQDFILFDVKVGDLWLSRENVEDVAKKLGLYVVPIVLEGTLYEGIKLVKQGLKSQWSDFEAEGVVGRPATELQTRNGNRVIVKIKGRDFKA